jgi:hypothetical protein
MEYITKTNAKKKYFLTDSELDELDSIEKKNPYRKSTIMTLYNKDDIIECLKTKFDTPFIEIVNEKLEELQKQKESRCKGRNFTIQNKKDKRKYELSNELAKYGLELREDSKLCQGYIDGTIKDKSLQWIANRMCQVKYLFEYCNIDEEIKKVKQNSSNIDNYEYENPFDIAERRILHRIKKYPNVFPWLENI